MLDEEGEEKEETDGEKVEVKRDTSHAPDLLEGPSVNQDGASVEVNRTCTTTCACMHMHTCTCTCILNLELIEDEVY